jgi:uncharacterized membrane protein
MGIPDYMGASTKAVRIWYWVITFLFVVFMLFGAASEVSQSESAQKLLADLHYPVYLNYILGIAKIIGAVVLIQWRFKTIKEWAYAGFTIDILGAASSSYFVEGIGAAIFTVVFLIPLFLSYYLWKRSGASGSLDYRAGTA